MESLEYVLQEGGPEQATKLLRQLRAKAAEDGADFSWSNRTPYVNTIPRHEQPPFPGNREIERRLKSFIRWNAMAMVVHANRELHGIGGHISTYASAATLYEVGFNHFFRCPGDDYAGDQVYFQGHASPGMYARAFLEGHLPEEALSNFRRELQPRGGLPSYPHPWLLPDFWEFPTVSMGLAPIMGIYQARFNRYLKARGLTDKEPGKVWVFLGDGEIDEPESTGAITIAARERLDNLIFVMNCNLQRLDGPVRGNGKVIQEVEALFLGAGWNVVKVIWGGDWDALLEQDTEGVLLQRMEEACDGDYQKYVVESGGYIRKHFFGTDPRLEEMVGHLSDEQLRRLRRGGHDPEKVYAAYRAAVRHRGSPTIVLAKTIKGYGLGEAGEGMNITHKQKELNEAELKEFRSRFGIPISDEDVGKAPFYKPPEESEEMRYLKERREELGGYQPRRAERADPLEEVPEKVFEEFYEGSSDRPAATTGVAVRIVSKLLKDKTVGPLIVPIVPDEARTFGMESLFRQVGIYSPLGQQYEPVDVSTLLYYRESTDGQLLEEGITEAGSMSSFIAAGTAYASHGINTIPFFFFYSMFGFQRIGDLIWAAADARCRGFLIGGTAGRTTLSGEGLQHQDGHSHLLAYANPRVIAYDPAFAYEIAVLIREGIRRMYTEQESVMYYLTVGNESYPMPPMPKGKDVEEGIVRGMYLFRKAQKRKGKARVHLLGSGAILNEALKAQDMLAEDYDVAADVWSVTSYKQLFTDALQADRWNLLHPGGKQKKPYVLSRLDDGADAVVGAGDYSKALPCSIAKWVPAPFVGLGTDGLGRSDGRAELRDFFEVDARFITLSALSSLSRAEKVSPKQVKDAMKALEIDPDKADPLSA
jgi:pyruvate dehydrogenase E1 component